MAYTEFELKHALASLDYPPPFDKWIWEANPGHMSHQNQGGMGARENEFLNQLWRYSWAIYHLTNTDSGDQVCGREYDTDSFSPTTGHPKYEKINTRWSQVTGVTRTINLTPGARGNALKMDKWHPYMNDCWLLGGVHRLATFRLISVPHAGNIWNFSGGYLVVTARELLGLKHFGYQPIGRSTVTDIRFGPSDPGLARGATLQSYNQMLREKAHLGKEIISELVDSRVSDLHSSIHGFDRSTLRPVR